jgi:hypothetical protein
MRRDPRWIGFTVVPDRGLFPSRASRPSSRRRLPSPFTGSVHPSTLCPSTEHLHTLRPRSKAFRPELRLPRFLALFATSPARSHWSRRIPTLRYVRPQAFAASRRLLPRVSLRACSIPLPRPGRSRSGAFSPSTSTLPRRKEHAPWPLGQDRSPARPALHDLHPSTSRPSSVQGRVHLGPVIHRLRGSLPSSRFVSLRSSAARLSSQLPQDAPPATLSSRPSLSRSPRAFVPGVYPTCRSIDPSPSRPPCSSFRA